MRLRAHGRVADAPRINVGDRALSAALCAGLLFASAAHLDLALTHASIFGLLSLVAGAAEGGLGVAALLRPSSGVWRLSIVSSLVLVELYVLNVTTGLPPLVAHAHVSGTRELLGIAVAAPNAVDAQGAVAQLGQLLAAVCAGVLLTRAHTTVRAA